MKMTLILLMLLSFTSCGESPLFNHKWEKSSLLGRNSIALGQELKFSKVGFSFAIDWSMGPQLGESKFSMKTWNDEKGTISGPYQDLPKTLHVMLWMPAMGHGSAPVKISKLGPGEYEVSNIYFIMGGKWEVKVQLLNGNEVIDEVVLPYTL